MVRLGERSRMFKTHVFYEYHQDFSYTLDNDVLAIYTIFMVREIIENNEVKRNYKVLKGDYISIPVKDMENRILYRLEHEGPFTLVREINKDIALKISQNTTMNLSDLSIDSLFPDLN